MEHNPDTIVFKEQMRDSLQRETRNSSVINIAQHDHVYTVGGEIKMVYFIKGNEDDRI